VETEGPTKHVDRDEIWAIYDDWYAETYDDRFHGGDVWNENLGAYKIELVGELLPEGGRWLDVGCGTGKHLSAHPDIAREGLDLSPSMVARAREANPGVPIHEGSYLDDHPEWVGRWDLVTNLWLSYQFVDSLKQLEQAVANMASWVAPGGALLMHVADCEDVARGIDLPWEDPETPVFSDSLFVTAVLWTWKESNGRTHHDLIAPQLQRMVNIVARHFEEIEVRRWPATAPGSDRPKGVIGRRKRPVPLSRAEVGDTYPYTLTFPPLDHPREHDRTRPGDPGYVRPGDPDRDRARSAPGIDAAALGPLHAELAELRGQVGALGAALFPPETEPAYDTLGVVHEQVWEIRQELADLRAATTRDPATAFEGTSTKRLASEVLRRINPLRPQTWKRLARRLR
jgi:SAM-dependent methyltransferase